MPPPRRPSSRLPPNVDPVVPVPGRPDANPVFGQPGVTFERGTILEVDARRHSYRVSMPSGRVISMGRVLSSPGDTALLTAGTNVIVSNAVGEFYIFGILPLGTRHTDEGPTLTGLEGHGAQDPVLDRGLPASARDPGAPTDLLPGDAALRGPDGAAVGALRGKVALLQGGPLARVQAFGDEDRVSITAGELKVSTWVGESAYTNEEGRTNFRWRGGTDQLTQTGPDEGRYTVALDVGCEGDVIRLELTNREGQALFRLHVDAHGRAELFAAGGFAHVGGDGPGAVHETAHHGSSGHEVTGDRTDQVGGNREDTTGAAWRSTVGSVVELVAGADLSLTGVNSASLRSAGPVLVSGADLALITGDGVTVDPRLSEFLVDTALPDSIRMGTGATSHGVKYEELVALITVLLAKVNALSASFATHDHEVVSSPTPRAIQNPQLLPFGVPLVLDLLSVRSRVLRLA